MEGIEKNIYEKYIKPIEYRDAINGIYILKTNLEKMNIPEQHYITIKKILKERKIPILQEIKTSDRPSLVREFKYGQISESKMNPIEKNKYAKITYDKNGEIDSVDYRPLEQYLDEVFIPENIHIKVRLKDKLGPEYYSIQLNKLVKLKLSEIEYKYAMQYLKQQGIIVCGTSEYPEDKFENYDYWYRIKNIQIPDNIDKEETTKLFKKLKKCTDPREYTKIRNKIIEGNMRLAKWVIYKMSPYYGIDNSWETYAYEGLINAVEKFDPDRPSKYNSEKTVSFSSFAVPTIKNFVYKKISLFYNIPFDIFSVFFKAKKIVEENYGRKYKIGDKQMLEEILDLLYNIGEISENRKIVLLNKTIETISYEDEETENIYAEENIEENVATTTDSLKESLKQVLETLTEREAKVIEMLYGLDDGRRKSLEEVGVKFKVTRERIRQIESKALRKLRHPSRSRTLKPYLGINYDTTNPNPSQMERHPSNPNWDDYEESDQLDMESKTYKDPLYELEEFYKEETTKRR